MSVVYFKGTRLRNPTLSHVISKEGSVSMGAYVCVCAMNDLALEPLNLMSQNLA